MRLRIVVTIVMLMLLIVFTLQNAEMVPVQLWLWNVVISKALLIFLVLAAGVLLGLIMGGIGRREKKARRRRALDTKEEAPSPTISQSDRLL